ncbi:hypothetical protein ACK28Q_42330 [Bradyrhizobium japonicum]|uniref:hypothetical protein n=1 Tax=Bradyrhizobium TaxID=374 RepID=UPI0011425267|nr:hypothetical protein [Bradyrhizobium japonicum]MCS3535524.1 hypothetical protein [Bradyrhizobium japonicum]MCS3988378.1 hypothetical protein [Bradyrhizobium japonicum]MCS4016805.1 hypothetical protein [Bradyrhizobium japonicum]MCS4203901.1 hypothetical protein [Bradyrhizobium japonicum]MDH6179077.1 hypothetical protein [Bradyrhizobium japonicum]
MKVIAAAVFAWLFFGNICCAQNSLSGFPDLSAGKPTKGKPTPPVRPAPSGPTGPGGPVCCTQDDVIRDQIQFHRDQLKSLQGEIQGHQLEIKRLENQRFQLQTK